jgi:hypothetical protein
VSHRNLWASVPTELSFVWVKVNKLHMPGKSQINWDKRSSFDVPDPVLLSVLSCPFYVVTPIRN